MKSYHQIISLNKPNSTKFKNKTFGNLLESVHSLPYLCWEMGEVKTVQFNAWLISIMSSGAVHHDDLLYLFAVPSVAKMFKITDPENLHVERFTRLWASFALRGYDSV